MAVAAVATSVGAVPPEGGELMAASMSSFIKHVWLDADDTAKLIKPALADRLTEQVAASERLHTGEIRLCLEAALPMSYLWRVGKERSIAEVTRERALMMFGKLGVWDTALNNGVLIYVLLAEHAIEIVADRGLSSQVEPGRWTALVEQMSRDFRDGQPELGLRHGIEGITAALVQHFAADASAGEALGSASYSAGDGKPNELPDSPVLR